MWARRVINCRICKSSYWCFPLTGAERKHAGNWRKHQLSLHWKMSALKGEIPCLLPASYIVWTCSVIWHVNADVLKRAFQKYFHLCFPWYQLVLHPEKKNKSWFLHLLRQGRVEPTFAVIRVQISCAASSGCFRDAVLAKGSEGLPGFWP